VKRAGATSPAWVGADLAASADWIWPVSAAAAAECEAALAAVRSRGLAWPNFGREDFPLPGFGRELDGVLDELENGRGLVLLRGFPVDRWAADDLRSLNGQIEFLLRRALEREGRLPSKSGESGEDRAAEGKS